MLVCWGCLSRLLSQKTRARQLRNNRNLSLSVLEARKVQGQDADRFSVWWGHDSSTLTWWKGEGAFYQGTLPTHAGFTLMTCSPPRSPISRTFMVVFGWNLWILRIQAVYSRLSQFREGMGNLNNKNEFSHSFWGWKSKMKVWAVWFLLRSLSLSFQWHPPCCVLPWSSLCPCAPLCLCPYVLVSSLRTPVWLD